MSILTRMILPHKSSNPIENSVQTCLQSFREDWTKYLNTYLQNVDVQFQAAPQIQYCDSIEAIPLENIEALFALIPGEEKCNAALGVSQTFVGIIEQSLMGEISTLSEDSAAGGKTARRFRTYLIKPFMDWAIHSLMSHLKVDAQVYDGSTLQLFDPKDMRAEKFAHSAGQWIGIKIPLSIVGKTDNIAQKASDQNANNTSSHGSSHPSAMQSETFISLWCPSYWLDRHNAAHHGLANHNEAEQRKAVWENRIAPTAVPLKVVIESRKMSVAECTRMQIGQIVDLPGTSLEQVNVMVESMGRQISLCNARLGVYKNRRAIALNTPPGTDFQK